MLYQHFIFSVTITVTLNYEEDVLVTDYITFPKLAWIFVVDGKAYV